MRRLLSPRLASRVALMGVVMALFAACGETYPNSTFLSHTEMNRDATSLWNTMLGWGTLVFIIVEGILVYTIIKFRRRPNSPEPKHVHGNTLMEITWTVLPIVILVLISVPTVRNIWKYQAKAPADAITVQVIGHQWWWEFRYPQYNVSTANELYLPIGRPVNFELRTVDVIHSFWIPALAGKRDMVNNRTNYLWFTPDSTDEAAYNGSCNEFCGSSHANMRFRAYTVNAANFESWAQHQAANAVYPLPTPDSTATTVPASNPAPQVTAAPTTGYAFPADKLGDHILPKTPIPASLTFDDATLANGDAARGLALYSRSACIGCHKIRGNPMSPGILGPDLTHIASRHTIAAGFYPNDAPHMARWIKNAVKMKPAAKMNVMGKGEYDPLLKRNADAGALTDAQIADIVAYLRSLK